MSASASAGSGNWTYNTVSQKKNKQNYFCYNYVKLPPNLTIFGTKMAKSLKLCEVHLTSPLALSVGQRWMFQFYGSLQM